MRGRLAPMIAAAAMLALTADAFEPGGHKVGPGEKKSPARGVRLNVEQPKRKNKSASLQKLLRK